MQQYRWEKGWSEMQLAKRAGVSRSTICQLENGKNQNPTVDIAFKIADALEVDVRELFYAQDAPRTKEDSCDGR